MRGRSRATVSRPPSPDRSKLIRCVRLREVYGSVVFGEHALTDTSVTVDVIVQPTVCQVTVTLHETMRRLVK